MKQILLSLLVLVSTLISTDALAQGSTTAAISGTVLDENGEALPGATIKAIHQPTGTVYGIVSNTDGRYRIANMQVGGPYEITTTFVGFQENVKDDIFLTLGQTLNLNLNMQETATELDEIEIISRRDAIIDGNRTGAETVVNKERIQNTPTVTRSIFDFTRLTPQADIGEGSDGFNMSLGGINNRYNAIYIDGAVNNDVFGLAGSGTNGGQTGVSPISVDIIDQIQISLAPFDVRQSGFAGGSINAVTRSGTNEFVGSAYYFYRNENLVGKTPGDEERFDDRDREKVAPFTAETYGASVGGPIIENKLFFFTNVELQRDETPLPFDFNEYEGNSTLAEINGLRDFLISEYDYNPGTFLDNFSSLESDKFFLRLDYNLNENNRLSARYNYTSADNVEGVQSDRDDIRFSNSGESFVSTTNSLSLELKSSFGNNASNSLIIGYTRVRDDRDGTGKDFPRLDIEDGEADFSIGSEIFSTANRLDQDIITLTNNFELYKGKHTIVFGTHNEYYDIYNLFIRRNFGEYDYDSLSQFTDQLPPTSYRRSYSIKDLANVVGDDIENGAAIFSAGQLGFYVQDEYQVSNRLKLTGGLRLDIPLFFDNTPSNPDFNNNAVPIIENVGGYDLRGAETGSFIEAQLMFSPRLGWNWDVTGKGETQVRGGVGVFNSRVPLVWPAGAYNNLGTNVGETFDNPGRFIADPTQQPPTEEDRNLLGELPPSGQVDLFADDFKFPQVFKGNIAVDQKLPWGMTGTLEFIYTDYINNIYVQNLNIRPSNRSLQGTPDNRRYYTGFADDTERYLVLDDPSYQGVGGYTGVFLGTNTDQGYTYNISAQVVKPFDNGLSFSVAYNYNDAYSLFDATSSQNSSQWENAFVRNGRNNITQSSRSRFASGNRVVSQISYTKEYGGFAASKIALIYNGQDGDYFSWVINDRGGSLTGEADETNNLVYIPRTSDDIVLVDKTDRDGNTITAQQQWNNLNRFINDRDDLNDNRGQYAERNSAKAPWQQYFDLRFLQNFYIDLANGKRNTLQFSVDIFNVANLINPEWGQRLRTFSTERMLSFEGFQEDAEGNSTLIPTYETAGFVDDNEDPWEGNLVDGGNIRSSRWQMQLGVRYIFGNY
jgi:hypothetical protein